MARTLVCGQPGAVKGTCWNGSPYQPVPVARDVPQKVAVKFLEQAESYPSVLAQQESVRAYPSPYGINAAHVLGYLSPITEGELNQAKDDGDTSLNGASEVGRAGIERAYDQWLRGQPGYNKVAVDSMGRVLGDSGTVSSRPGDTLVTSIDAKVQADVEKQLHDAIMTARHTYDKVTHRNYVADSGAAVVMEAKTGPHRRDGQPADVRPLDLVGRDHPEAAQGALLQEGGRPAALAGHAGPVRARLDVQAADDDRRAQQRLLREHHARLLLGRPGRQPAVQELRVGVLRQHHLRQGARRSPATPSSTAWA